MPKRYMIGDGRLVLTLREAEEGGYIVESPLDPELLTEANSVREAFANARDALKSLRRSRAKLWRRARSGLMMGAASGSRLPRGWDQAKVRRILRHYEGQPGNAAVAEDEVAYRTAATSVMCVPTALMPTIRRLIATYKG
jgi:hypothetical protein